MREKLKENAGKWGVYSGLFVCFGKAHARNKHVTALFYDVKDSIGNKICNHIWINATKALREAGLLSGEKIQFSAKVDSYTRFDGSYDYTLVCARSIVKLGKVQETVKSAKA